jgi:hypothetical protein
MTEGEGRRRRGHAMLPWKRCSSPTKGGREPVEAMPCQGLVKHGKARAAPTAELLEDVVRSPHMTSQEALSWRYPLALLPFPGRCLGTMPVASLLASSVLAIAFQLGKALPGSRQGPSLRWEGGKKALPLLGREACTRRILVLAGMRRLTSEGTSPCQEG